MLSPGFRVPVSSLLSVSHRALPAKTSYSFEQQRTFLSSVLGSAFDVSGYPSFLPFTISSNVTKKDTNGYPAEASLKVGYDKFGLEEVWNSIVSCDPSTGTIEARSSKADSQGLFEVLQTKWHIDNAQTGTQTKVKLDLDVKFRNPVYDQMFAQVEGKVASTMIAAFEKRVQELEAQKGR
ncbi:hypothetical protein BT93_L0727 [Corymbia citriodora subsp. variegata]|uniref:Coenzyme Q-binding protein COQ10 START domain-containing protein n=1 Tax=Corymbia citriodora subsp. variegata TaxID=360336 RepID=A0A8T0CFH1_CORYI|nr:hypothetical protein BT93_L0727 [Corymbia citriodora subsp. variegata]